MTRSLVELQLFRGLGLTSKETLQYRIACNNVYLLNFRWCIHPATTVLPSGHSLTFAWRHLKSLTHRYVYWFSRNCGEYVPCRGNASTVGLIYTLHVCNLLLQSADKALRSLDGTVFPSGANLRHLAETYGTPHHPSMDDHVSHNNEVKEFVCISPIIMA